MLNEKVIVDQYTSENICIIVALRYQTKTLNVLRFSIKTWCSIHLWDCLKPKG